MVFWDLKRSHGSRFFGNVDEQLCILIGKSVVIPLFLNVQSLFVPLKCIFLGKIHGKLSGCLGWLDPQKGLAIGPP